MLGDHPWTASILRFIASSYRCLAKACLRGDVSYFLCCNKGNRRRLHAGNAKAESVNSGIADQAEMYSREALELQTRLLGEHHDTARSHVGLSDILIVKKDFKSALEHLEKAFEIQKKVLGEEHETTKKTLEQLKKVKSMVE